MRSNAADYAVTAPSTLAEALAILQDQTRRTVPIAGGTEIMVALGAGRLGTRSLLSLHLLHELRFINLTAEQVSIGAASTFTDLQQHPLLAKEFPLLVRAAAWIGSLANQNRATLGGNLVNASPAADAPPALLVYDAELTLVSSQSSRTVAYSDFHLGYKKTVLRTDELLFSIQLPRRFSTYTAYLRKVGTRNAQAISKVAIAGLARLEGARMADLRLAAASLNEVPCRLYATERALLGQQVSTDRWSAITAGAHEALRTEISPIDDIRSTARYRLAVACNLVDEFLRELLLQTHP